MLLGDAKGAGSQAQVVLESSHDVAGSGAVVTIINNLVCIGWGGGLVHQHQRRRAPAKCTSPCRMNGGPAGHNCAPLLASWPLAHSLLKDGKNEY